MPVETERKFLIDFPELMGFTKWEEFQYSRDPIWQYYLVAQKDLAIRLRTGGAGKNNTILTIKYGGDGMSCYEEEFHTTYMEYLTRFEDRIGREIRKDRYTHTENGRVWEIDVFQEHHQGLVVAELECPDAEAVIDLPSWIRKEVTFDSRFKNAVLATSDEWKEAILEN